MILVHPSTIAKIDKYASDTLGIPVRTLMHRAGKAVADAVRANLPLGARIGIFAGKGNNGGDGYAAACLLHGEYDVTVFDVFAAGQRSDEGRYFLAEFTSLGGTVIPLGTTSDDLSGIGTFDCVIDAIFGTGFVGELPEEALRLSRIFASLDNVFKLAVDVPLGVNAADGRVDPDAVYHTDATVVLGFVKTGLVSYPAKEYVGKLVYDNIGLHNVDVLGEFPSCDHLVDGHLAASMLLARPENSSKGSFGKALIVSGSCKYRGAAHLSLEAALRSGVGYVTYLGEPSLCDSLLPSLPEAIYSPCSLVDVNGEKLKEISDIADRHTAILVGPGSSVSDGLLSLIEHLLSTEGAPIVLDADAINALSRDREQGIAMIRGSRRAVVLTPHPLELSRLSGLSTEEIQSNRLSVARMLAKEYGATLVLKGAATVITDGITTYVNSSGSSALAKAGSGDVLAGFLAALIASGHSPLAASAIAVYFHGLAADVLSEEYSRLGVIPSDLSKEMCRQIRKAEKLYK